MKKNYRFGGAFNVVKVSDSNCCYAFSGPKYSTVHITKVIYNNPVVVVFWSDNTKTMSKCQEGDKYSKEVGLILAVLKKVSSSQQVTQLLADWVTDKDVIDLKQVRANQKVAK